jgi:cell wall-associated NlpC family hydrolase
MKKGIPGIAGFLSKKLKERVKDKSKNRKKIFIILTISILLALLPAVMIAYAAMQSMSTLTEIAAILSNDILNIFTLTSNEDESTVIDDISEYPKYGKYPADHSLRIKQEMLEICDQVGSLYGIPGKFILAILTVESNSIFNNIPLEKANGSLYTDLCVVETTRSNGTPFFIDGENKGVYKDKHGNSVIDPIKVGKLATPVGEAIGPFQFLDSYIEGRFTSLCIIEDGVARIEDNVPMMSRFDEKLGFMRPNPFYFPDAALACAKYLKALMNNHENYINELRSYNLGIPDSILQEILFFYGADGYHGDTSVKGDAAKQLHDNMGKLYADVYLHYKDEIGLKSLGEFAKGGYPSNYHIRAIVAGVQFGGKNVNYDGTFDRANNGEIEQDSRGKYVELSGYRFYEPFISKFANTEPFNVNYKKYVVEMPAKNANKFGFLYGFQGLNAATYYTNTWLKQIEAAPKQVIGGQIKYPDGLPYKVDSNSIEEMLVAGSSLVGKVRYILGGGHSYTANIKTINPLWRRFNQIYVDNDKANASIHRLSTAMVWCPIHQDPKKSKYCVDYDNVYTDADTFLKNREKSLAAWGNIYGDITTSTLTNMFKSNISKVRSHTIEGLDCSGFTSWMFNQVVPNHTFEGRSYDYYNKNSAVLTKVASGANEIKNARLLPGDIVDYSPNINDGHVFVIVGPINEKNDVFVIIESTPPEVRFGVAYKSNYDSADYNKAVELVKNANQTIGGTSGAYSARKMDASNFSVFRYNNFTDKEFLEKYAEEIMNIITTRLPDEYKGR